MRFRFSRGVSALLVALSFPVAAQIGPTSAPVVSSALVVVSPSQQGANPALPTGTSVPLTLLENLTTKNHALRVGSRFRLETSEPVQLDGVTLIPVGTPALGEITEIRNKGMWGKSGRFVARLLYLTVNGRRIRLKGAFDDKGKAGGAGAVAVSALVFLPAGFFMTGTSAHLPIGTEVPGFIDEDVPLAYQSPSTVAAGPNLARGSSVAVIPTPTPPAVVASRPVQVGNAHLRCETCR